MDEDRINMTITEEEDEDLDIENRPPLVPRPPDERPQSSASQRPNVRRKNSTTSDKSKGPDTIGNIQKIDSSIDTHDMEDDEDVHHDYNLKNPTEEELMMAYLNRYGVMRTISALAKEILEKKPVDPRKCQLILLEWLVSRLTRTSLATHGIYIEPVEEKKRASAAVRSMRTSLLSQIENKDSKRNELLAKLEQKYIEEEELRVTTIEIGMAPDELEHLRSLFTNFDTDSGGTLSLEEIKKVLAHCGYNPSQKTLKESFELYDNDKSGTLELPEFLRMMKKVDPEVEKKQAIELGFSVKEYTKFKKLFLELDDDNTGELNAKELRQIMRILGHAPSAKAMQTVFNTMDTDGSGQLDFIEFLAMLKNLDPDEEKKTVLKLGFSQQEHQQFRNAFEKIDRDDNAQLSKEELMHLLQILHIECSEESYKEIMVKFDKDGTEKLDFIEFLYFQHSLRSQKLKEQYLRDENRRKRSKFKKRKFTDEEVAALQDRFNGYDKDRSGTLEMNEIASLLKDLGLAPKTPEEQSRVVKLLQKAEFNGSLTFQKFLQMLQSYKEEAASDQLKKEYELAYSLNFTEQEVDDFHEVFRLYDSTGDGTLDIDEVQSLLRSLNMDISLKVMTETFRELDSDRSGVLEFGEFLLLMRTLTEQMNNNNGK